MQPTNYWKLGLFVSCGIAAVFGVVISLGATKLDREVVVFKTYVDEPVEGLDLGSPVKFRGVRIGQVTDIRVAPDRRHVELSASVYVDVLERLELRTRKEPGIAGEDQGQVPAFVPADLRVQLVSAGITGVRFLQLDFFALKEYPPPALPFAIPHNYIPAAPSTLKSLEQSIVQGADRVPGVLDKASRTLARIERALDEAGVAALSSSARGALDRGASALSRAESKLEQLDVGRLSAALERTLARVESAAARAEALLVRVEGKEGLLSDLEATARGLRKGTEGLELKQTLRRLDRALERVDAAAVSVERAGVAVSDLAREGGRLPASAQGALRSVGEAADALRRLADALERDADMLLKGRARGGR